jgi:isopentenyl-diphosphate Delta-isomerase
VLENELCPVYAAYAADSIEQSPPAPDPEEVAEVRWVDWDEFRAAVRADRRRVSPWCAMQLAELTALGSRPLDWTPADPADLPPAALG